MDNSTEEPSYEITINPKIDTLFGIYDYPVPTKQDAFKPIEAWKINEDGKQTILNNFYVRKPDNNSIKEFHSLLNEVAREHFPDGKIIKRPEKVEVIISISITESRFKLVDVDNLAKTVLDGLNEIAFEDDSQVVSLICSKHIHPLKKNGILIGVTKLTQKNQGFNGDIKLYNLKPNEAALKMMEPYFNKIKNKDV